MREKLIKTISKTLNLPEEKVTLNANFSDDLGLDSLDVAELVIEIEDEFSVDFKDSELEEINTVQDIVSLVAEKLSDEED